MGEAHKWKMAETIAFLDDQGKYKFNLLRFNEPVYRELFNAVNNILAAVISHKITDADLRRKESALRLALQALEDRMFYKWFTFTRHGLLHICMIFISNGRFCVLNELDFERNHRVLKKLTRGTKSSMKSLSNHLQIKSVARMLQNDPVVCPNPPIGILYFIHNTRMTYTHTSYDLYTYTVLIQDPWQILKLVTWSTKTLLVRRYHWENKSMLNSMMMTLFK